MTTRTGQGLLQDYAARTAERAPDSVAVVDGEERWTFAALEEESNRLAHLLRENGCGPGDRVTLFLPKGAKAVVGMLATMKIGCAYVPIDLQSPAPRVEMILRAAQARLVLATPTSAQLLDEIIGRFEMPAIGTLDESFEGERFETAFGRDSILTQSPERPAVSPRPDDAAHILFTSGSTGVPKGVVITHANVTHFVDWGIEYFGFTAGDRHSCHPPLHFDLSTFDIYGALGSGAELHMVPSATNLTAKKLADFIRERELTQWFSVPSTMTYLAKSDVITAPDFPTLKRVIWCGEVLPTSILVHWMERVPHASFTNLYGPTEATIASSYYTLPSPPANETDPIPIGVACPGEELLVLDAQLGPSPVDEIGDLFISGVGLSPGYWQDEEKTRAAFLPDPRSPESGERIYRTGDLARLGTDGLYHFIGRADSQIKSRGYRIELGEIEANLADVGGLREYAVVGTPVGGFEGVAICCAFSLTSEAALAPADLREALAERVPTYMLPTRWLELDDLPKNVNGKIDRPRLRDLFEQREGEAR